jgi:hypothetical protein
MSQVVINFIERYIAEQTRDQDYAELKGTLNITTGIQGHYII